MTTYSVFITRVTEYTVEALDETTARLACLEAPTRVAGATIPEVTDERVDRITSETTYSLVVQVVFEHASGSKSSPYAYGVPDGLDVQIGDDVLVPPAGYRAQPSLAKVVDVGRGGYDGPLKALVGKLLKPDDAPERSTMERDGYSSNEEWENRDTSEDEGFGRCPDCGFAYQWEGSRPCSEQGGPF